MVRARTSIPSPRTLGASRRRATRTAATVGLLSAFAATALVAGQNQPPATAPAAPAPPAAKGDGPPGSHPPLAPVPEERAPLLREGSFIVRAVGKLERDETRERWIFRREPDQPGDLTREIVLMPCALLEEIERMADAAGGHRLVLEMTGEIFVYGDRNYLMPMHPPLVVDHEALEPRTPDPPPAADGEPSGDRAEDIIRELEQAAGPRTRRPDARARSEEGSAANREDAWREGMILVERRGRVRRLPDGAYMFVFDADAEGLSDPPVILLPSQMLERLAAQERRRAAEKSALLLNGHVYVYDGQAYLLPTLYRVARERTPLVP